MICFNSINNSVKQLGATLTLLEKRTFHFCCVASNNVGPFVNQFWSNNHNVNKTFDQKLYNSLDQNGSTKIATGDKVE